MGRAFKKYPSLWLPGAPKLASPCATGRPIRNASIVGRDRLRIATSSSAAGSTWTPLELTNLRAWYEADTDVTESGGAVSQWDDQSGNGFHLTQGTAANKPTYEATGLNSKPTISFDGTGDYLAVTGLGGALTSFTVAMVCKPGTTNNDETMWYGTLAGNFLYGIIQSTGGGLFGFWGGPNNAYTASGSFLVGTVYRTFHTYASPTARSGINSGAYATGANTNYTMGNRISIASLLPDAGGFDWAARISAVVIKQGHITDDERTSLLSYWTKWS